MCPNMCFGIVLCINSEFNENRISDSVQSLSLAHPFIRALISHENAENRFYYDVKDDSQAEIRVFSGNLTSVDSPEIIAEFERITSRDFDLCDMLPPLSLSLRSGASCSTASAG